MTGTRTALCEKCGNHRVDLFGAMITVELDFSELCCCDVSPEFIDAATSGPVVVCKNCSKRMQDGRPDASTQWIFRNSFCTCETPDRYKIDAVMLEELVQQLTNRRTKRKERPSKEEPEIQVDKRKFPIESFQPLKQMDSAGGRVFKCRDRQLGTLVEIRILKTLQPEQLMKLQQETEAVSKFDQENILQVLDLGVLRETYPVLVTEYAEGETLRSLLDRSGKLQMYTAVNIISQVCEALSHAHSRGILHWNLTPNNILLKSTTKDKPVVKLLDFGIALNAVAGSTFETKEGFTLVGTTGYMSPEQATGQALDPRSEIYSIGCVLFEMLTGELPFKGQTPMVVFNQQTEQPVPHLRDIAGRDFPSELEKIMSRCLRKNKEVRYASVDQLKNAINAFASLPSVRKEAKQEPKWKTAIQEHKILVSLAMLGLVAGTAWATYSWLLTDNAFDTLSKSGLPMDSFLATMGSDNAKVQLGRKYLDGTGVQQDNHKAEMLFTDASTHGFAPAEFWLGYCYLKGFARIHNRGESFANAYTSISEASETDKRNYARAYSLISQAAEKGYPPAERYMGLLIRLGMDKSGVITPPTSKGRAKRMADSGAWFKKAAAHGDPQAINYMGIEKAEEFGWSPTLYVGSFDYSNKSAHKYEEVFKLFKEAGEAGQPDAQYNMALCYELGIGTPATNELAKKWYQTAAEAGVQDAQFRYGFLLELEKSADAVKWYKKAAEQNNLYAQIALCRCYSEGFCIPANRIQAQYWYVKVLQHPEKLVVTGKELATDSVNLQLSQEKIITGMERIFNEHLEMPHLLTQAWGPSGIKCWPRGPMRDIDLIQLSTMKDVTYLDLNGMSVHDRGTKFFPGLPVTMLRLVGQDLSRSGYGNIAKLKVLKGLELSGDLRTDGLDQLADCRDLVFVGLTGLITQETVDQLAAIKSLKNIVFHCRNDVSLASWSSLPDLESVRLDEVTQKTVNSLAAMKNLKALTINEFEKTGSSTEKMDLSPLLKLPLLEKLRLSESFNKNVILQLKNFPRLKNLSITSTKGVTDEDLHLLKQIPAKSIEIFLDADCKITDKGLMILGSIPNVSHVNISVSPVTPGGVKAFRAKFPNHSVSYSENGKVIKEKPKDQVEIQVEKQIKDQIEKQIKDEQEKKKKDRAGIEDEDQVTDEPTEGPAKAPDKGSSTKPNKKPGKAPASKPGKKTSKGKGKK